MATRLSLANAIFVATVSEAIVYGKNILCINLAITDCRVDSGAYVLLCAIAIFLLLYGHLCGHGFIFTRLTVSLLCRSRRRKTNVTVSLTFVTLFMFSLSTAHMVMVFQYACTQYLDKDAAHHGDAILQRRGDPMVYVPTILEIVNVSDFLVIEWFSRLTQRQILVVLCRRCYHPMAGMGFVGPTPQSTRCALIYLVGKLR